MDIAACSPARTLASTGGRLGALAPSGRLDMPPIARNKATFRIGGDALVPHLVTEQLGIEPSYALAKGDPLPRRPSIRQGTGVWQLKSNVPQEAELEEHLKQLFDVLEP